MIFFYFLKFNKDIAKKKKNNPNGFTLMELLVAVGIFAAVSVIAVGALLRAQTINTKMQQTHIMLDGMNLSMEAVTRDIRYGRQFHCTNTSEVTLIGDLDIDIPGGTNAYRLRKNCDYNTIGQGNTLIIGQVGSSASTTDRIIYYLNNGKIMKWEGDNSGTSTPITSDDVEIQELKFFVNGAESFDPTENLSNSTETNPEQPIVTVVIAGVTKPQKVNVQKVYFKLQSTVTPRELDY